MWTVPLVDSPADQIFQFIRHIFQKSGNVDSFHLFTAQLISFSRERRGAAELEQEMLAIVIVTIIIVVINRWLIGCTYGNQCHLHLDVNMLAIAMKFCSAGSHSVEKEVRQGEHHSNLGPIEHIHLPGHL